MQKYPGRDVQPFPPFTDLRCGGDLLANCGYTTLALKVLGVAATGADREAREETRERAVACEESENILRER